MRRSGSADPGARTLIGTSGNLLMLLLSYWEKIKVQVGTLTSILYPNVSLSKSPFSTNLGQKIVVKGQTRPRQDLEATKVLGPLEACLKIS